MGWGSFAGGAALGVLGLIGNSQSAASQYKYQMKMQEAQQQWLEKMSNTAHQREVTDLRAAGLNPLLSMGGQGASTPSSGMGQAGLTNNGETIMSAFDRGMAMRQQKNQNMSTEAQVKLLNEQAVSEGSKRDLMRSQTALNFVERALKNIHLKYAEKKELLGIQGMALQNLLTKTSTASQNQEIRESESRRMKIIQEIQESKAREQYEKEKGRNYNIFDITGEVSNRFLKKITGLDYPKPWTPL